MIENIPFAIKNKIDYDVFKFVITEKAHYFFDCNDSDTDVSHIIDSNGTHYDGTSYRNGTKVNLEPGLYYFFIYSLEIGEYQLNVDNFDNVNFK